MTVLAVDAGTTGVTALVVTEAGEIAARGYREFPQHFPRPGWVEHDPAEIWAATLAACRDALAADAPPPTALGLTNQRETLVVWDRTTLAAPRRAIVWQDRRTGDICQRLRDDGVEPRITELTGLRLDPYFTGSKLRWLAEHDVETWSGLRAGRLVAGTVDAYLVARLTGGRVFATDPSNASRTLLFDLTTGAWSSELADLLGVAGTPLPEVRPTAGEFGTTDRDAFLGHEMPVAAVVGDQQAALFGQACHDPGAVKCTYGTGSFVLVNTGSRPVRSRHGLLTTVAWDVGAGPVYALEGAIFVTGAAVQWLRDGLGVIAAAPDVEPLARSVPDSAGVVFVPALTGLGAPHWDPDARGAVLGLTRGTTRGHLARATLEAIAYQVRDVVDVMTRDAGIRVPVLAVDGGAAGNDLLCELQADVLGIPVERPAVAETTALGAAFLAGLATGVWSSPAEIAATRRVDRRFEPAGTGEDAGYRRWRAAVAATRGWARADPPARSDPGR